MSIIQKALTPDDELRLGLITEHDTPDSPHKEHMGERAAGYDDSSGRTEGPGDFEPEFGDDETDEVTTVSSPEKQLSYLRNKPVTEWTEQDANMAVGMARTPGDEAEEADRLYENYTTGGQGPLFEPEGDEGEPRGDSIGVGATFEDEGGAKQGPGMSPEEARQNFQGEGSTPDPVGSGVEGETPRTAPRRGAAPGTPGGPQRGGGGQGDVDPLEGPSRSGPSPADRMRGEGGKGYRAYRGERGRERGSTSQDDPSQQTGAEAYEGGRSRERLSLRRALTKASIATVAAVLALHDTPQSPHKEHMRGGKGAEGSSARVANRVYGELMEHLDSLGVSLDEFGPEDEDEMVASYLHETTRATPDPRARESVDEDVVRAAYQRFQQELRGGDQDEGQDSAEGDEQEFVGGGPPSERRITHPTPPLTPWGNVGRRTSGAAEGQGYQGSDRIVPEDPEVEVDRRSRGPGAGPSQTRPRHRG